RHRDELGGEVRKEEDGRRGAAQIRGGHVRELRLHRELYRGEHVDQAIKIYDRFAKIERAEEESHWIVRLEATSPERERKIAGELANYALGLTIQQRGGI